MRWEKYLGLANQEEIPRMCQWGGGGGAMNNTAQLNIGLGLLKFLELHLMDFLMNRYNISYQNNETDIKNIRIKVYFLVIKNFTNLK